MQEGVRREGEGGGWGGWVQYNLLQTRFTRKPSDTANLSFPKHEMFFLPVYLTTLSLTLTLNTNMGGLI